MKFCDKLVKMRKNNNMSQEQLADRLGMSRQAISKWESGQSIPDMAKILELCKILNCNLEDLVDDGLGGSSNIPKESKNSIHNYLDELLNFITRTINMFWSMTLGEKTKCIVELLFLMLFLYIIWNISGHIISSIFDNILRLLPGALYSLIRGISSLIYGLFGIIVGVIIIIHIFKVRYLDYFITIEDNNTTDKTIEEPIDDNNDTNPKKVKFIDNKKNKIIIRDPKHSPYTFFDFLGKIIIYMIKFMLLMIAIPCIICFVFLCFGALISIWLIKDGIFFLGTTILLLGAIIVNYLVLRFLYNFILDQKFKFNLIFISLIVGLSLIGVGAGISFCNYLTFDKTTITNKDITYTNKKIELDMTDNLILGFIDHENVEIIPDNNMNNIKLEIIYNKEGELELTNYTYDLYDYNNEGESIEYNYYYMNYIDNEASTRDFIDEINYLIKQIKNKNRIYYDYSNIDKIIIHASQTNIDKIKNNYNIIKNN